MAYTYHGTRNLVMAPGRSVQTFPSGLVRVERRYFCRKSDAARYRSVLAVGNLLPNDDGAPAIDGLYIFPEPQEQSRDDGFVEFRVTAYGRSNAFSLENMTRQVIQSSIKVLEPTFLENCIRGEDKINSFRSLNEVFTVTGVSQSDFAMAELISVAPIINDPLIIPTEGFLAGGRLIPASSSSSATYISIDFNSFDSKNFGRWTEFLITWQANAVVQLGGSCAITIV